MSNEPGDLRPRAFFCWYLCQWGPEWSELARPVLFYRKLSPMRTLTFASMALLLVSQVACQRVHYIEDGGSLAAVNALHLRPGDRIVLRGGARFDGPLTLASDDSGGRWRPIVVESIGDEPAVIDGGAGSAVVIDGASWVVLRNVKVVGAGRKEGNEQGVGVRIEGAAHIRIDSVEASGFQRSGVEIIASHDVRLTNVYAHDNGYAGISASGGRSRDIYVGYCRAINNPGDPTMLHNHSGNGIVLMNVAGALIEHCEAAENGWDMPRQGNGPVGIWCAFSDRVTIQHCVSHHNKSPGHDGGGFDFDGGTTNSIMRHNLSHDNDGWGYLLYEFGSGVDYGNNIIRDCVSEDDGDGGIGLGVSAWATYSTPGTLGRCIVERNTIRNSLGKPAVHVFEGEARGVIVRDNLFITRGPAVLGEHKARFINNRAVEME